MDSQQEKDQHGDVKIFVNTIGKEVPRPTITYETLVKLAFPNSPGGADLRFDVIYRDGPPQNREGSLNPGQSVKVTEGMIFDVTPTTQS